MFGKGERLLRGLVVNVFRDVITVENLKFVALSFKQCDTGLCDHSTLRSFKRKGEGHYRGSMAVQIRGDL